MTEPTPFEVAFRNLCPRCGAVGLFSGIIAFAPRCRECGLDFDGFNVGDGPAAFLTFGIGTLITALAIALELGVHPPWWVHVLLWTPVTLALVIGLLRIAKGLLITVEYRQAAREGRLR